MTQTTTPKTSRTHSRLLGTLKALVKTRISVGLITILPIVITVWLVWVVFGWLRDASLWIVNLFLLSSAGLRTLESWGITPGQLTADGLKALPPTLQWGVSILCLLLTFMLLYIIGLFATNVIGRRGLELVDQVAARVPFVKTVYGALKQIMAIFGTEQKQGFQRVALVPFPNELTRSVAFITNTLKDGQTGEELCMAFIATTPNPTTGFVFVVRRSDITELDWSVEDAVKVVMSGGILSPGFVTMLTGQGRTAASGPAPLGQLQPPG